MSHAPNPFDFVPFASTPPVLKKAEDWLKTGTCLTGYLEVQLQALTPLHIVGKQDAIATVPANSREKKQNFKIQYSHFNRRHGQAIIPAASIRGLLRAFIETACNGWASQMTPFYAAEGGKRKVGFRAVDDPEALKKEKAEKNVDMALSPSLPGRFAVPPKAEQGVDLASFLFGYIPAEGEGWQGRIKIEDVRIASKNLSDNNQRYRMPDVEDSAFMGGPNPSASSWWYQYPHQIRLRDAYIKDKDGNRQKREVADFIGSGFRGRKFYYHQMPEACVNWYIQSGEWHGRRYHPSYTFPVECLKAGSASEHFRIDFAEIPEAMLKLLLLVLAPGPRLRHKLGYGKPYGFGSIEFKLTGGSLRGKGFAPSTPLPLDAWRQEIQQALWDPSRLNQIGIGEYLHWDSLASLAPILWYDPQAAQQFHYPPFGPGGFQPIIRTSDLWTALPQHQANQLRQKKSVRIQAAEARQIAQKLAQMGRRPALHFEVYQENAAGYQDIRKRTLEKAI